MLPTWAWSRASSPGASHQESTEGTQGPRTRRENRHLVLADLWLPLSILLCLHTDTNPDLTS